jgi:hypothetical protein
MGSVPVEGRSVDCNGAAGLGGAPLDAKAGTLSSQRALLATAAASGGHFYFGWAELPT